MRTHKRPGLMAGLLAAVLQAFCSSSQAGTLDHIRVKKHIDVCIWPHYYAVTYKNPKTGVLQGLDIDMARALAKDLNTGVRFVETSFAEFVQDLLHRRCDIAMMGVAITAERQASIHFSEPYLSTGFYGVTTRTHRSIQGWNDIDRPGHIVVVQKGTLQASAMPSLLQHARLRVVEAQGERESEVESGRADVFIADYPYTRRVLASADWARVLTPDTPVQPAHYAYAVPPGDPAWLERINVFVKTVKQDGRLEAAARRFDLLPIVVR